MAERLSPEREQEIRESHPGDWYAGEWRSEYVDDCGDAYYRVIHVEGESVTRLAMLPDWAGPIALFIADAHDAVPELLAEVDRLRAAYNAVSEREHDLINERDAVLQRVAELEAQRERRRVRLIALQNDALNMRGALSPNGEDRKVPMPLGDTLTPAVEWLINRVAELEAAAGDKQPEARGLWSCGECHAINNADTCMVCRAPRPARKGGAR
ncbi:hypothetical protein [Streptomyces sp. NPDC001268]|uniref:hypothetical protein n=1 Tax=Streptomyces sp. NPDC001268 TaxID=3364553 RepID=UPI0036901CA8